jgi:3-hydroxybutyryl-CoA dehydratase
MTTPKKRVPAMKGKTIADIAIGDIAEFAKTVSEGDIYQYAGISGDFNPVHVNEAYAEKTFFKTRIAHGMLSAGFISNVLGNQLPGPGSVYIRQELNFLAPVRIGDTITARITVISIDAEKNRVTLKTECVNQGGITVIDGQAVLSPPKSSKQ